MEKCIAVGVQNMKKMVISIILFIFTFVGIGFISYSISKERANAFLEKQTYKEQISPLRGQLVVFVNGKFNPCWIFRGEFKDAITGATFDVYVSLSGELCTMPK